MVLHWCLFNHFFHPLIQLSSPGSHLQHQHLSPCIEPGFIHIVYFSSPPPTTYYSLHQPSVSVISSTFHPSLSQPPLSFPVTLHTLLPLVSLSTLLPFIKNIQALTCPPLHLTLTFYLLILILTQNSNVILKFIPTGYLFVIPFLSHSSFLVTHKQLASCPCNQIIGDICVCGCVYCKFKEDLTIRQDWSAHLPLPLFLQQLLPILLSLPHPSTPIVSCYS